MKLIKIKCFDDGRTTIEEIKDLNLAGENKASQLIIDFSEITNKDYIKWVDFMMADKSFARFNLGNAEVVTHDLTNVSTVPGELIIAPLITPTTEPDAIKIKYKQKSVIILKQIDAASSTSVPKNDVIFALQKEVEALETSKVDKTTMEAELDLRAFSTDIQKLIKAINYNSTNGIFTITAFDGTASIIDLPMELIVTNGSYDSITHEIVLELASGGEIRIPVENLVTELTERVGAIETKLPFGFNSVAEEVLFDTFTVTTVAEEGYKSPKAMADVTGRLDKKYDYIVIFDDIRYEMPVNLYLMPINPNGAFKAYEALGDLRLYTDDYQGYVYIGNEPFFITSDINDDITNSIDVFTPVPGTHTIKIIRKIKDVTKIPNELLYDSAHTPIQVMPNAGTFDGISIGLNRLMSTRGTFAIGLNNNLLKDFNWSMGINNLNKDNYGFSIGVNNTVGKTGFAMGVLNESEKLGSFVAGRNNRASADYQSIFGRFNKENPEALLQVGNGTSEEDRVNEFEVLKDGTATSRTSTAAEHPDNTLVTKDYVDQTNDDILDGKIAVAKAKLADNLEVREPILADKVATFKVPQNAINRTAKLMSIEGEETTVVDGQFVISKPTKIISKSNNLFDYKYFYDTLKAVSPANINYVTKDGRNCIKIIQGNSYNGIKLYQGEFAPNTVYKFKFERFDDFSRAIIFRWDYTDGSFIVINPSGTDGTWGEVESLSNGKTIDYIGVSFANAGATVHINIDKFQLQLASNPTTEYIPYTEHIYDLPALPFEYGMPTLPNGIGDKWTVNGYEKNVGKRNYNADDEIDTSVITDMVNTFYQLATPEKITTLAIPEFISTYDGGTVIVDNGLFTITLPDDITNQLNTNTEQIIDLKNKIQMYSATDFETITRQPGIIYGAYDEITKVVTWYYGD